jgi:hypothetical protein
MYKIHDPGATHGTTGSLPIKGWIDTTIEIG